MDNRSRILNNIKKNKPTIETKLNLQQFNNYNQNNLINSFCENLRLNHGSAVILDNLHCLEDVLINEVREKSYLDLSDIIQNKENYNLNDLNHLNQIQVLILTAHLAVSENGAIWVDDEMLRTVRLLPFIVERLIFIVYKTAIVPTMHEAYKKLDRIKTGFGTFIAGPSKTGDIEQNLIIGAHGTLSHHVIVV